MTCKYKHQETESLFQALSHREKPHKRGILTCKRLLFLFCALYVAQSMTVGMVGMGGLSGAPVVCFCLWAPQQVNPASISVQILLSYVITKWKDGHVVKTLNYPWNIWFNLVSFSWAASCLFTVFDRSTVFLTVRGWNVKAARTEWRPKRRACWAAGVLNR